MLSIKYDLKALLPVTLRYLAPWFNGLSFYIPWKSKFPVQVENSEAGLKRLWKKSWKVMEFEKLSRVRTLILEQLDDCNSQVSIGEGNRTQVFQDFWLLLQPVRGMWREVRGNKKRGRGNLFAVFPGSDISLRRPHNLNVWTGYSVASTVLVSRFAPQTVDH